MTLLLLFFSFFSLNFARDDYTKEALGDAITSLPGMSSDILSNYNMFSGYIDVYEPHNRNIFYWFVESLNDPENDPVALWTNGGPGCSGLAGFFTEQGPFRPYKNLSLYVNPYSWVNVANMVFIEAPSGVGFSYSNNISDYNTGDNKTAIDNYHFIQGWLEKFPNYKSNKFYITSESYGGHYMPTLAQQIVIGNNNGGDPAVNFQGVFVGNPYTDPSENERGQYDTWFGHSLVSLPTYKEWYNYCRDGNHVDNVRCTEARVAMNNEVGVNIDPYALDYPVCHEASKKHERFWFLKEVIHKALKRPIPLYYQKFIGSKKDSKDFETISDFEEFGMQYEACESNWMSTYLNEKDVQTAIHAKLVDKKAWDMCGGIKYSAESEQNPMEPTWKWLLANAPDLHFTVISGDDDSVCGTIGTQSWIFELGYNVTSPWSAWLDENGQTGGYVTKFKASNGGILNFVTVHSAGHMIPETQPSRSLQAFTKYLKGQI